MKVVAYVLAVMLSAIAVVTVAPSKGISRVMKASVCVQLFGIGNGSGTIVHSSERGTYVATASHVITRPDTIKNEMVTPILVKMPTYDNKERTEFRGYMVYEAVVVANDPLNDLAILRLKDTRKIFPVLPIASGPLFPSQGDATLTVGCGMGRNPYITEGRVNAQFWIPSEAPMKSMSTSAPAIYGNSGGAMSWFNPVTLRWELIGVVSMGPTEGSQFITHMMSGVHYDTVKNMLRKVLGR